VLYSVTANGSADFQRVSPGTTNSAQSIANFRVTSLSTIPISSSAPFAIQRQVLYEQPNELFEMNTDEENTVGAHRLFLVPTKLFFVAGVINPLPALHGNPNTLISFPQGLDVEGDLSLTSIQFLTWSPKSWPFITPTSQRGSVGSPDIPGWLYLFENPGLVQLPSLIPWTAISGLYPGSGWPDGIDLKLLETDPNAGSTVRQIRLRPGKQTPIFSIAGHTHLFVLQGSATITPAGADSITLHQNDYIFLPEGLTVTLANPEEYTGPGAP